MLLKNLMEDKQLDFNLPLLSVRRFTSSIAASESESKKKVNSSLPKIPCPPIYKSELKSGPVRNPGTVPFVWEKTPGRPKEESNLQTQALEQPPIAPKLPPGRALNDKLQSPTKGPYGKTFAPPQTEIIVSSSQNVSSLTQNETKYGSSKGDMEETGSSGSKDSDEAYVDALDTLSRTESFFLNCSISGVSGLDGPDMKPSGIFSTDPQTRDFMMGRFLPAAKAVASETPPYATRKQPIAREPLRQMKKAVIVNKQQPPHVSSPNNFPNKAQYDWWEESEDEDDYIESQNSSAKVCGLFPQFFLKNSFCLLNPMPGMKIQAQKPVKPAYSVRRRQAKSSYLRFSSETENEHAQAAADKGFTGIAQSEELIEDKSNLKSGSSQINYRSNFQKPGGASLLRHLQGNDASSYHGQISLLVHQEKGFLGIPEKAKNYMLSSMDSLKKGSNNFQELLASESINQESGSACPVVEKTLYVDAVHKVISSNLHFPDRRAVTQCMEDDLEIVVKPVEMETPSADSSLKDIKYLNGVVDEKVVVQHQKRVEPVDSYSLFSHDKYAPNLQLDATDGSRRDQDLIQHSSKLTCLNVIDNGKDDTGSHLHFKLSHQETSHGLIQDSNTFTNSKVAERRKIDLESDLQMKSSHQESSHGCKLPLALPLPRAPSESWLKRTLPNVSSKNSSSRSCLGTCNYIGTQASTAPSADPKWETIVRSSNVHHGHLRFSEEQLPTIPEA
ncbi:hypothetical protein DITRI_Ditri16bG0096200 [Diplodiscus trichospermus]